MAQGWKALFRSGDRNPHTGQPRAKRYGQDIELPKAGKQAPAVPVMKQLGTAVEGFKTLRSLTKKK